MDNKLTNKELQKEYPGYTLFAIRTDATGKRLELLEIGFKKDYDSFKTKYTDENILILKSF